ncbi:BREX system serine/threonine kinase PglW [Streptomyces lavendulae]|uniref:BREX system serine/threonine kinase PglW n=1 Tax=Streptomyces lavendulae TaxID=1914 RepID=UPI0033FED4B4
MASAARPTAPKPGPPPRRTRWFQPKRSGFGWEQEGLDHVRQLMPDAEPYRAWATFQFTAPSGRVNECDLLVAVPGGLYLLELKGHPGRVVNHGDTWQFHDERVRTLKNPLHLTDLKAKELKSQLERAARSMGSDPRRVPFIKPAVFLHDPDLVSELDEFQRTSVFGRNGGGSGLPGIWDGLLGLPPERESWRVTPENSQFLETLIKRIGVSHSTAHLRYGDGWRLEPRALDAGPGWEDRLAQRDDGLVKESGRVRIYLAGEAASAQQRQSVDRAARREYQVLQGINHRGIVQAVQIHEHVSGPAILFRHRASDLRLDAYLDAYGSRLTPELRLDLVRQLAEAVRYAHNRSLYHRALSARSVYVSAREDGGEPVLRIADWQTAARDFETTLHRTLGDTPLDAGLIADVAQVYLAPETDQEFADPVDLDVFGLGSLAYLLLTGRPPADRRSALVDRLAAESGLHPYAVADGVSAALDDLVFQATAADARYRLPSADEFLRLLDEAEADAAAPEPAGAAAPDPLTVLPGQQLDDTWTVTRVLGTGATARALLVRRTAAEPGTDADSPRVFKVALDHDKDARLYAEARALKEVGGGHIVKLLAEPHEVGGRTVLEIEYAGGFRSPADRDPVSLGSRLRGEGPLGYGQLERFGNDLFAALDSLAARGVRHRDLKPDNLGLFKRSDGSWQLMLFDFSLADAPDQDLHAGTRGYLDPFLGGSRRERYDDHAERYAAAVTLHEMASGERPVWGDAQLDPLTVPDAKLYIARELFDQSLSEGLTEFFERALHRDVEQRYDSLRDMQEDWRRIFHKADAAPPATTPATVGLTAEDIEDAREQAAAAAGLETPLEAAGLSPRAVSVAAGLGASTVKALLEIPPHTISRARGAGNVIRKELNRRHRQWTQALRKRPARTPVAIPADAPEEALESVETLAARLTPPEGKRRTKPRPDVVRATLQLPGATVLEPWPGQSAIAKALGISQPTVSQHHLAAVEQWAALPWLTRVRHELIAILSEQGRIMTAQELAGELRARHGAGGDDPAGTLAQALAVVRAAADTEARKRDEGIPEGSPEGASGDSEPPARLGILRRGGRVVLALEDQPGSDDPTPAELADYAAALGALAEKLATRDPLPGRATVLRELRALSAPEGMASLADTRLVDLAAAMAGGVGVSPRLELFPLGLDLVRALRISQAPAGVRADTGITTTDLVARVRARFPGLSALADTTYVELDEALRQTDFPLAYDHQRKRFMPRLRESAAGTLIGPTVSALTSTGSLIAAAQGDLAMGRDPRRVLAARLDTARRRGGFLALTVKGPELPDLAARLSERFDVLPVSLDELFLSVLRELATEHGVAWQALLTADASLTASGTIGAGLASYTRATAERVVTRAAALAEQAGPRTVLLAHEAALAARYWSSGGREALVALQEAARRPADAPHGLWLLVPMEDPEVSPALDGRTVDIVDRASEWAVLDGLFLKELKGQAADTAKRLTVTG